MLQSPMKGQNKTGPGVHTHVPCSVLVECHAACRMKVTPDSSMLRLPLHHIMAWHLGADLHYKCRGMLLLDQLEVFDAGLLHPPLEVQAVPAQPCVPRGFPIDQHCLSLPAEGTQSLGEPSVVTVLCWCRHLVYYPQWVSQTQELAMKTISSKTLG